MWESTSSRTVITVVVFSIRDVMSSVREPYDSNSIPFRVESRTVTHCVLHSPHDNCM